MPFLNHRAINHLNDFLCTYESPVFFVLYLYSDSKRVNRMFLHYVTCCYYSVMDHEFLFSLGVMKSMSEPSAMACISLFACAL